MSKNKINWLLILQAWAILWVVIGHSPLEIPISNFAPFYVKVLFNIAYSFHMPLFIFVSGYLFYMTRIQRPMAYWDMIKDKMVRLGIPFIAFTILAMFLKTFLGGDVSRESEISIKEFIKAFLFPYEGPLQELWFLAVIMWFFLLRPIWAKILQSKGMIVACGLITLAFAVTKPQICNEFLCFSSMLKYSFYFFVGMVICKWSIVEKCKAYKKYILFLSLFIYILFVLLQGMPKGVHFALLGIALSIMLALYFDSLVPNLFSHFRDYTYQIYLMGIFAQFGCKILTYKFLVSYNLGFIACILVGIYIPVFICKIIEKINWKPLLLCVGLKGT